MDTAEQKPGDQPETVKALLSTIHAYFAILANCERLSLSDTDEANVLCRTDITLMGGNGLDLVERVQDKLKTQQAVSSPGPSSQESDPFAGLKELPLDRAVTLYLISGHSLTGALAESPDGQIVLFEPRNKGSSHYHVVPLASITAWSDMRGEDADPLFLYNRQYLTERQIREREKSGADG